MKSHPSPHARLLPVVAAVAALCSLGATPAQASSHREAPAITTTPKVDATDFYMFNSYETGRSGFVTLVANYQPMQDGFDGPNYHAMDANALYEIHIDNVGDAKEHLTFQFRVKNNRNALTQSVGGSTFGHACALIVRWPSRRVSGQMSEMEKPSLLTTCA